MGSVGVGMRAAQPRRSVEERNRLVEQHIKLAERFAAKLWEKKRMQTICGCDEFVSAAFRGLIDAANAFDESRNTEFATYARLHMNGRILDWLKEIDPLTRDHRDQVKSGKARPIFFATQGYWDTEEPCSRESSPWGRLQRQDVVALAMRGLALRERIIIRLYFFEDWLMGDIGKAMGIHESRVSQLLTESLEFVRDNLIKTPGRRQLVLDLDA